MQLFAEQNDSSIQCSYFMHERLDLLLSVEYCYCRRTKLVDVVVVLKDLEELKLI